MNDIGSLFVSTLAHMGREPVDQVFNGHPFYAWMNAQGRMKPVSGGTYIEEPVGIKKNGSVDFRGYRENIPLEEQDPLVMAQWEWRYMNGSVLWFEAQEKMNSGPDALFDLIQEMIDNLISSMRDTLSPGLFNGSNAKGITGLPYLLNPTGSYGGFDRTDAAYEPWRPMAGDRSADGKGIYNTAEPIALYGGADGGIKRLYRACSGNGGVEPPDIAVTTEEIYEKIEASIEPQRIRTNGKMADLGFEDNLQIDNCVFIWDENCPAGTVNMLNSRYLKLRPHTSNKDNFNPTKPENTYSQGVRAKVILVEWMGNMTCTRPNRQGQLSNKS